MFADDLRDRENAKIACGKEHFKALERGDSPARFVKASRLDDVLGSS
jgi:type III restriction enzyme